MAGRGSYGALPAHGDFDADDGVPAPPPPVSTIARRRPTPDDNAAAPDGHHFISTAQSTEGLGIQSPPSGAFGAALHSQREGGKPGNMADTLQGAGPACSIDRATQSLCSLHPRRPSLKVADLMTVAVDTLSSTEFKPGGACLQARMVHCKHHRTHLGKHSTPLPQCSRTASSWLVLPP
jgi:hypothetical protein